MGSADQKLGLQQRWGHRLGALLVMLGLGYFGLALQENLATMPVVVMSPAAWLVVAFSLLVAPLSIALLTVLFTCLLRDFGITVGFWHAYEILGISQIGKYLPGNVGHFVGRAALAKSHGVPLGPVVNATALEIIWTLALGFGLAAVALLWLLDAPLGGHFALLDNQAVLLSLATVLALLPWLAIFLMNAWLPALSCRMGDGNLVPLPRLVTAVVTALILLSCFLLLGVAAYFQAQFLFGLEAGSLLPFVLLFTAAWVAGYVVPGAPGGLGIREALLLALFSPVIGAAGALAVGVSARVLSTIGDGLTFLIGISLRARG